VRLTELVPGRAWHLLHRARQEAHNLLPVTRTSQRVPDDQVPPPPDAFAAFGAGSWVVPPALVIGAEHISIGTGVVVMEYGRLWALGASAHLHLGDGVRLARFNTIICGTEVIVGDDVASSDSATILDTWEHPLRPSLPAGGVPPPPPGPVIIGDGAYLGFNCTIGPGVRVGKGAFVGEGAVVVEDVPAHSVVYGNPATVTRRYDPDRARWEGPTWP
jgi:acetyltransferase-like isoleucine patch superfamily enzyme